VIPWATSTSTTLVRWNGQNYPVFLKARDLRHAGVLGLCLKEIKCMCLGVPVQVSSLPFISPEHPPMDWALDVCNKVNHALDCDEFVSQI
jgi:hypothetical protein